MRILLADDNPELRSALRLLVEREPGMQVSGEVANTVGLLTHAIKDCPDVILLDLELAGLSAIRGQCSSRTLGDVIAILRRLCPNTAVIGMSSRLEAESMVHGAGADAFVHLSEPPEKLAAVLRQFSREVAE